MAGTAKNVFRCLKMYSNVYSPKRVTKYKNKIQKWQKWPKIANNCKISEIINIVKKLEKLRKIHKNVKQMPKRAKNGQKMATFQTNIAIVFLARNYLKN